MDSLGYLDGYLSKEAANPAHRLAVPIELGSAVLSPIYRTKALGKTSDPWAAVKKDPFGAAYSASELAEMGHMTHKYVRPAMGDARFAYNIAKWRGDPMKGRMATAGRHFASTLRPGFAEYAKHLSGVKSHPSAGFLGTGVQKAIGPAWAASMAADFAKGVGYNPQTEQWNLNVAENLNQQGREMERAVNKGHWATQPFRGAWQGFLKPGRAILNAGTAKLQTPYYKAKGMAGLGLSDYLRYTLTGRTGSSRNHPRVKNRHERLPGESPEADYLDYMNKASSLELGAWWDQLEKLAENPNPIEDGPEKYERPEGQEHLPKQAIPPDQCQPMKPGVSDPKDSER